MKAPALPSRTEKQKSELAQYVSAIQVANQVPDFEILCPECGTLICADLTATDRTDDSDVPGSEPGEASDEDLSLEDFVDTSDMQQH